MTHEEHRNLKAFLAARSEPTSPRDAAFEALVAELGPRGWKPVDDDDHEDSLVTYDPNEPLDWVVVHVHGQGVCVIENRLRLGLRYRKQSSMNYSFNELLAAIAKAIELSAFAPLTISCTKDVS